MPIAGDVIGVEAGGVQGALPLAEQPRLERRERGLAKLVAAMGDRAPVQVFAAPAGGLDQCDDPGPGPSRPAKTVE